MFKNRRLGGIICIAIGVGILIASLMPACVIYIITGILLILIGRFFLLPRC